MGIRHYKFQPNEYVLVMKNGNMVRKGLGLSFFCNTLNTSMSVVPTVSFDTSFAFDDIMTSDFQRVNVQGDISYIIRDYKKVAGMIDFSFTTKAGYENKKSEARQVMGKRISNLAKTSISKYAGGRDVKTIIRSQEDLASFLMKELADNKVIGELGLDVIVVSILSISPQPETKKALEAAVREEILQQQDDAIYKRRNAAIDQERIVRENELDTEIKMAEKEREKEERAIAAEMAVLKAGRERDSEEHVSQMARNRYALEESEIVEKGIRTKADAQAYANGTILKAFESVDREVLLAVLLSGMDSKTMIAKAFNSLAENAGKIGSLNISPDLLEALMVKEEFMGSKK